MKLTDRQLVDELFASLVKFQEAVDMVKETGLSITFVGILSEGAPKSASVYRHYFSTEDEA